jgi:acyl-CoA thioesterase
VGNAFLDTTAVVATGPGTYAGEIDAAWNLRPVPQGGIVSALAARAMERCLDDPRQQLRTLHTTFVAQVAHGAVDIDVELLRRGRSMSQLRADLRNPGKPHGHVTMASFGAPREGFSFTDLLPPRDVPPPDECGSFRDEPEDLPEDWPPWEPMPFWEQCVEGRPAIGHAPWEDYVPDRAERVQWYRFDEPPFGDDGTLDPYSLIVLCDVMPGALDEKVGAIGRRWFPPSVDLTVHLLDACRSPWVMAHSTARFAGDGYASGAMALWDCGDDGRDAPRLVAYATQLFFITFQD